MKVDTHIHSSYSMESSPDRSRPNLILKAAAKAGIDGLCISDHNTMDGYREAARIRKPGDPIVIPACEVSTTRGHLLVLGVDRDWPEGVEPEEVVEDARSQGGVVSAPHPFYLSTISVSWLARELKLAVEAFNAMASILVYPNLVARKFATKYGLPITGGSDAHSYETVGLGLTLAESDTVDGFMSDIARGRSTVRGRAPGIGYSLRFASRSAAGALLGLAKLA